MNQLRKLTDNEQFIPFMIITALAVILWLFGPAIAINHQYCLQDPARRFYVIVLLYMVWIIKIILFDAAFSGNTDTAQRPQAEAVKKLYALQGRFHGAIQFLKNTVIDKQGVPTSLEQLPWFLMIGPQNSGKTSLLANAHIHFVLSKQLKPEQCLATPPSENCDWWATRDTVFIDVPGNYIISKQNAAQKSQATETHRASLPNIFWHNLLNLMNKYRKAGRFGGIVIVLNLPEIIKPHYMHQQKQIINDLEHRIRELRIRFGTQLPFYFVITKCDMVNGFIDFFGDSSQEELAQAWGISMPTLKTNERLLDVVTQRFNALINRLNNQLIWRLHQERSVSGKINIKDFPLQMERVKKALLHFLKALNAPTLNLKGIYLTSATQKSGDTTHVSGTSENLPILTVPAALQRPYFVKQLLSQAIHHQTAAPQYIVSPRNQWQRRIAYGLAAAIVITSAVLLGKDFQKGMQKTYSIQHDLAQYQIAIQQNSSDTDRLVKALPLLDALQQASTISKHQLSKLANFLSFYSIKSRQTATAVYHDTLQTIMVPEIKRHFESYLQNTDNKNPLQVYAVLKAYLMLSDTKHLDTNYIANTLKNISAHALNEKTFVELSTHIQNALASMPHALQLNQELILQSRKQLTSLSTLDLAYLILKNINDNDHDSQINLGTNLNDPSVFISKEVINEVPNMFTQKYFTALFNKEIWQAARESIKGNWVLGNDYVSNAQPISTSEMAEQLKNKYVKNYIDIWESLLANLHMVSPKTLAETSTTIGYITSNHSPLLEILKTIQQNTAIPTIMDNSPKLKALNTLLVDSKNSSDNMLYHIFISLQQLRDTLDKVIHSKNPGQAAFEFSQARLHNITTNNQDTITQIRQIADKSPEPLKSWLQNIATLTWNLMLRETGSYIETAWKTNIIPVYQNQFANFYPFNTNATQETDLGKFIVFFNKNGILQNFYQNYLKLFVDDSEEEWQWRTVDNQKMPFSNSFLTTLQTAHKYSSILFSSDNKLDIPFTLQPMRLASNVKSFKLSMNGQLVSYNRTNGGEVHSLNWPGNNLRHSTIMDIVSIKNQLYRDSAGGEWGWFRIVDKSLESINTRKEIVLSFSVNGYAAKYLLYTQSKFNPFLPANIQKLRLPEKLEEN